MTDERSLLTCLMNNYDASVYMKEHVVMNALSARVIKLLFASMKLLSGVDEGKAVLGNVLNLISSHT